MGTPSLFFLVGSIFAIISFLPPAIHHFRMGKLSSKQFYSTEIQSFPEITIFIPARDEELLLEKKIMNVISMDYPHSRIKILVIDSGSIDRTGEIAREVLTSNAGEIKWSVERLEYPGKSRAVNRAIELIETEFFIMTDVDSISQKDSIMIAVSRLVNEENIGAICGRKTSTPGSHLSSYRLRFNRIRIGESILDSTPIFEGSFCAFRTSSVSEGIDESINADDTQLAILSRRNNFRSVMDPRINFIEPKSNLIREFKRSIRRSQGISRCLIMNRDLSRMEGYFGAFFSHSFYFYLIFPWLIVSSALLISPTIYGQIFSLTGTSQIFLAVSSFLFFVIIRPMRDFTTGLFALIFSHLFILLRADLSVWRPIR